MCPTPPAPARRRPSARARAATTLFRALGSSPGEPDPALCRRVDRLLDWLAHGHGAGVELALADALDDAATLGTHGDARALVARLERVRERAAGLAPSGHGPREGAAPRTSAIRRRATRRTDRARPTVIGALRIRSARVHEPAARPVRGG
ncbi:MAG: hypothetical protein ACODAE_05970 [Gemmatimonadota bacterium]